MNQLNNKIMKTLIGLKQNMSQIFSEDGNVVPVTYIDVADVVVAHKKTQEKVALYLESGQLIVMHGETQRFWKHSITKTKTVADGRISLTFRHLQPT